MGVRSDPARALHKMMCIPGIASLQNQLNAPKHLSGTPGIDDFASRHLDFDPEVSFNSGNRIYRYSFGHMISSCFSAKGFLFHFWLNSRVPHKTE
jgi:hypothetical protein